MSLDELSAKRRAFVLAYVGEAMSNATEAARIAGYAHPGPQGYRLLKNVHVAKAIADASQRVDEQRILTAVECQVILSRIALGEIGDPETNLAGELVGMSPTRAETRIKAIDRLAKMRGYDAPKQIEHRELRSAPTRVVLARVARLQQRLEAEVEAEVIEEPRKLGGGHG